MEQIPNNTTSIIPKKTNIYVTKQELTDEYNKSLKIGKPTEKFMVLITKIAKNFIKTFKNTNTCDTNACVNYAVAEVWMKWNKFDPTKSDNIFSFFTTMISNDIIYHWKYINRGKKVNISIDSLFNSDNK